MYRLHLGAWNGTLASRQFLSSESHTSRAAAIASFEEIKEWWTKSGYKPYACILVSPDDKEEELS